jgi:ABC-type transport system substrate-binding protein
MKLRSRAVAAPVLASVAATALLAGLAACSSGPPASGGSGSAASGSAAAVPSLRVGINYTVTTLNPAKNGYQFEIAALTLETLAMTVNAWAALETGPASKRMTSFLETGGSSSPGVSGYDFILGRQNTQDGEWNIADYTPPTVDQLMTAGIATTSPAKRFPIYAQLLRTLAADEPYVPIYSEDEGAAVSTKFSVSGFSQFFANTQYALDVKAVS